MNTRIVVLAVTSLCLTACAGTGERADTGEAASGFRGGFLSKEDYPDSLALLPPPPSEGSAALALDRAVSERALALRDTPRWDLAAADAHMNFSRTAQTFSCALDLPITEADTPSLYTLLRRSLSDAGLSGYGAKNHYQRTRPFVINGEANCTPSADEFLRGDGSYPSGHTAFGWAWALILAEVAPDRADAILARGRAYGESRIVCNVHWYSDVIAGRMIGAATVARMHASPEFLSAIESAKREVAAVRAAGLKPTKDCAAEASALSLELPLSR